MARPDGWTIDLPPLAERTLAAVMARGVAVHPDKMAIRDADRVLSYGALYEESLSVAAGFERLGVGRQQPVAMMLDNHVDIIRTWFSLGLTARIEVPVNTAFRGRLLAHVIANCGARVIVIEEHYADRLPPIADALPALETVVVRGDPSKVSLPPHWKVMALADLPGPAVAAPHVDPWDLIGIMYTSGTTGASKGVRAPHALAYQCATPDAWRHPASDDVNMITLPLFHIGAQWMGILGSLIGQASIVIMPRFSASNFWADAKRYDCTFAHVLGSIAEFLYRQPPGPGDTDHPIRNMAMAPVLPEVKDFIRRFGLNGVCTGYGMTEAGSITAVPIGAEAVPGQIGWVRPDVEARIVDAHDQPVAPGEPGELIVRHRDPWSMMDGYHDMPEATVDVWRNMWLHTGDMVRQAKNGQLVFCDRIKDAIRRRGENISSFEVEREITEHAAVFECAVVAVPSETAEDEVKACVVLQPGAALDPADLIAFLVPRLPYFMVPRFIEFLPELPKTPTAKIRKHELRERGLTAETWDREVAGVVVTR